MSKAFYKPTAVPKLLHVFPSSSSSTTKSIRSKTVEVWNTTCIVTNFGKNREGGKCTVLINPSNPELSGVKNFPYFPRGGPVPKDSPKSMHKDWQPLGYVSQWGGMEVGSGMLYPASVIDGLVHQLGGWRLAMECKLMGTFHHGGTEKCPVGKAVVTSPGGSKLRQEYDNIVHTTPPFYKHHVDLVDHLRMCYQEALLTAFSLSTEPLRVAVPLIGAGARGFPVDVAIDVAASECIRWRNKIDAESSEQMSNGDGQGVNVVAFGIPELKVAEALVQAIEYYDNNGVEEKIQDA